ncbi:unnamed protein product [Cuscuta campestris]|uniref:DUF4378 domain-containing protein n=1 Tax=Cuscuta campestris TaxID=132261 RepID=A0A484NEA2_9ASTE|nr:unnamed protein product [Cuscuta campestris]
MKLLEGDEAQAMEEEEEERQSQEIPFLGNKTSLRARIKAFILEYNNDNGHRNNYKQLPKSQTESSDEEEPAEVLPGNSNMESETLQDDEDDEEEEEEEEITPEENQNLINDEDFENELLLIKIMQDHLNSNGNSRLVKPGSFPSCHSKRGMFKPLQLRDKYNEIWHHQKRISSDLLASDDDEEEKCHKNAEIEDKKDRSWRKLAAHRRSSSLNESLERYSRLYEHSSGKELKSNPSKSLKAVPFTRTRSLSNVESIFSLQIETLDGAPFSFHPTVDTGEKDASVDGNQAAKCDGFLNANTVDETDHDMEAASDDIILSNLDSSVLESCFQEKLSTEEDYGISREAKMTDDPDLSYVMAILECSGFTQNFFHGKWHSRDQPLSPSAMEEVEARWHDEEDRDEDLCNQHHKMLFDLANEVCVEIYDRSFPYYPAALSPCCKIRSLPTGKHIIQEICSGVSSRLSLEPEMKQTLECVAGRDLEMGYGWMNLQLESEFVALEIEDMVFDDLLDEISLTLSSSIG